MNILTHNQAHIEAADAAHAAYIAIPDAKRLPSLDGTIEYEWTSPDGSTRIVWGSSDDTEGDPNAYVNATLYDDCDYDAHVGCDAAEAVEHLTRLCQA